MMCSVSNDNSTCCDILIRQYKVQKFVGAYTSVMNATKQLLHFETQNRKLKICTVEAVNCY